MILNFEGLQAELEKQWSRPNTPEFIATHRAILLLSQSLEIPEDGISFFLKISIALQVRALLKFVKGFFCSIKKNCSSTFLEPENWCEILSTQSNRPILIISAHFLGIETVLEKISTIRSSACVVVAPEAKKWLSSWHLLRFRYGESVLPHNQVFSSGLKILRENKMLALLVDAPLNDSAQVFSKFSALDPQTLLLAPAARTVRILARRTDARIIWVTSRITSDDKYVGQIEEIPIIDIHEIMLSPELYFSRRIKQHLNQHGVHQLAWAALANSPALK